MNRKEGCGRWRFFVYSVHTFELLAKCMSRMLVVFKSVKLGRMHVPTCRPKNQNLKIHNNLKIESQQQQTHQPTSKSEIVYEAAF